MRYQYDLKRLVGQRVLVESIRIDGKAIDPAGKYTVTVNTGILGLLAKIGVRVEKVQVLPEFEYTVVKDHIASLGKVTCKPEGRIRETHR